MRVPDGEFVTDEQIAMLNRSGMYEESGTTESAASVQNVQSVETHVSSNRNNTLRPRRTRVPRGTYPWLTWTNGEYHTIDPQDWGKTRIQLQVLMYRKAADRGLVCKTETLSDGENEFLGVLFAKDKVTLAAKWMMATTDLSTLY